MVLRLAVLANAVVLNVYRRDNFVHPTAGLLLVAVMVLWTAYAAWAYLAARRRTWPLLVADLAVAVGVLVATPAVKGDGFSATVPGFWVMGALLAWAVVWRWRGGLAAGVLLGVVDLAIRRDVSQSHYGNAFLLVLGGLIIGFLGESLRYLAAERDAAQRSAAAAAERARLARAVHDGVLQTLALVQRRGHELGGDAAELGRLAGEQEARLRSLIRDQDAVADARRAGTLDLAAELARLDRRPGVSVAGPGEPVVLPAEVVTELVAAVAACLDNVAAHVGPDAPAWVLLEALPDRVEVSVRDEGPGIPGGRLESAVAEGRLGVSGSVRGRVADLGGTATLHTGASGTEWELVVPRGPR